MEKKLISLSVSLLIFFCCCYAQDYEAMGDAAIRKGDYKSAVENFEAQLSYMKYKKIDPNSKEYLLLEKKCSKAEECRTLRNKAAAIVKKLDIDYFSVLSSCSKSKGDEQVVSWNANIKQLSSTYNSILQRFSNDSGTRALLSKVNVYKPLIDQAYFDAYTMPEKWSEVQATGTVEAYQAFLEAYPEGRFADNAYQFIHKQEDEAKWASATNGNSKESYSTYLQTMPRGFYVPEAVNRITMIDDDASYWEAAVESNTIEGYKVYQKETPNGFNLLAAKANMSILSAKRDFDNSLFVSCSAELDSFRSLSENPVSLLLEQNRPAYYSVSESCDYKAWDLAKNYRNAKVYVESHPDGEHYAEIADVYAGILADSWDFLAPGATKEQIAYVMSFAQNQYTKDYVQGKVSEANKLEVKFRSSTTGYVEYLGKSKFFGYDNTVQTVPVSIIMDNKPKNMPAAEIIVDGKTFGGDSAQLRLAPGYHNVTLKGWAYTNNQKYLANKNTPTHTKQYVIHVSEDGRSNYYMKCPGASSYRAKNAGSTIVISCAVLAGTAAGVAAGIAKK